MRITQKVIHSCDDRWLRYMRNRLGKHPMAEPIIRCLWMDRLPVTITQNWRQCREDALLDHLADSANRIFAKEHSLNSLHVHHKTSSNTRELEQAVADLRHQFTGIKLSLQRSRLWASSRSPHRLSRCSHSRRRQHKQGMCRFHCTLDTSARICNPSWTFGKAQGNWPIGC